MTQLDTPQLDGLDPQRIITAGDWHQNTPWAHHVITQAAEHNIPLILHAGDFMAYGPLLGVYLNQINRYLEEHNTHLVFIDGNHEDHHYLQQQADAYPGRQLIPIRQHITWARRGTRWTWHGKTWLAIGGAVSPDRAVRHQNTSWWPQEEITLLQAATATLPGQAHVMLTHDAPTAVHPPYGQPPHWWDDRDLARSAAHQDLLLRICAETEPQHLIHGHLHMSYQTTKTMPWGPCEFTGLNADGNNDNWRILHPATMTWQQNPPT